MDQVEKYIMTRLYKSVFCPETTDDEKKDLATQKRIRWASLHSNRLSVTVSNVYSYIMCKKKKGRLMLLILCVAEPCTG